MVTLVTGGSGSGKSAYAEAEIVKLGERRRIYIATMKPWDEECRRRIGRHRIMRSGKQFETVECYDGLEKLELPESSEGPAVSAVLLECVSNLVSNELFGTGEGECPDCLSQEYGSAAADRVVNGILRLRGKTDDLVIVTNEVFSDGGYGGSTDFYLQVLGEVNCRLGALADRVIEVAAGIPVTIK